MSSCEYCMSLEDLADFSSKNNYIVALGFVTNSVPSMEKVFIPVPKSKLERYKRGDYEWQVIESEKLPLSLSKLDIQEALTKMCEKYGPTQHVDNTVNMSHEEKIRVSNKIAGKLIQKPYVHSIYLTGSTAIGIDKDNSDVDLLVVLEHCPGKNEHYDLDKLIYESHSIIDPYYIQQKDFLIAQNLQYPLIKNRKLIASKQLSIIYNH